MATGNSSNIITLMTNAMAQVAVTFDGLEVIDDNLARNR